VIISGIFAVQVLGSLFAITQLKALLFQAGITDPDIRDVGFSIHIVTFIALQIFALVQVLQWNKRNRDADQARSKQERCSRPS
jgi:hypothetical protein